MAAVTPPTITPTSLASFEKPTQFNPGQDPSKLFGKDFDKHLGNMQGKHKPVYTPHIDTGDHVVIINAATVRLTGRKEEQKLYRYHSGYEGGVREERAKDLRGRRPTRIVEEAVRGMLPKTKLGEAMWRKLKVYAGPEHPHAAQKPIMKKTHSREVA